MTDSRTPGPFAGGTAVVTGGASGLGRALAHTFADQSMHVVVADRNGDGARALADELPSATAFEIDIADTASIARMAHAVGEVEGDVQVLCANVGVARDRDARADHARRLALAARREPARDGRHRAGLPPAPARGIRTAPDPAHRVDRFHLRASPPRCLHHDEIRGARVRRDPSRELAVEGIGVTMVLPGGMDTTFIASSEAARPSGIGPSTTTQEDLAMVANEMMTSPSAIASAEHAARHVVDALLEDRPYLVTHGPTPPEVRARFEQLLDAYAHADD